MRRLSFLLPLAACVEPTWTDERVYVAMKAAAGPSAIGRSVIAMLQDCVDYGSLSTDEGLATCTVDHENGEETILNGTLFWENNTIDNQNFIDALFDDVTFGDGDHAGVLDGSMRIPVSPGVEFELDDLELTLDGDPFEHWTDEDNEFLVAVAPLQFTYESWAGEAPGTAAWATGRGDVQIDDDHAVKLAVWADAGPACFGVLPMARFEVEDDELDLTIEPSDWESCDACWTWRNDAGETGELCLNDVL